MATYSHDILLRLWAQNQLTTEQAIGQILQLLYEFEPRLKRLELTLTSSQVASSSVKPQPVSEPPAPSNPRKRQSRRRAAHR